MRKKLFSLALIGIFGLVVTNFGTKVDAATRSYGNGVYCNNSKCWVNRPERHLENKRRGRKLDGS